MYNYTYKFRIYPNKEQVIQLSKTFGCTRYVYNYYLEKSKDNNYKNKTVNNNDCNRILKKENVWLKSVDKFAITNSIYNLDNAFKHFFNHGYGYPKFKSKSNIQSYQTNYTNNNIEVLDNSIKLPKLGKVKAKLHRCLVGRIINATIKKYSSGCYYVSILVEREIEDKSIASEIIGIDMGLKDFVIDNIGNKYTNPEALKYLEYKLIREQQRLSKKTKKSNNYYKQVKKIARIHNKIENIRNDYLHKLSTSIINENQVIIVEDLDVSSMKQNKMIAKKVSDVSISKFISMLEYKSNYYGRVFKKVNRYYASSQICHVCGYQNKEVKNLNVRNWICPKCLEEHDRDINASINILEQGLLQIIL